MNCVRVADGGKSAPCQTWDKRGSWRKKEAVGTWIHLPEQSREVPSLCMDAMLVPLVSLEKDEQERGSEEPVPVHTWRPLVFALSKASTSTSTPW